MEQGREQEEAESELADSTGDQGVQTAVNRLKRYLSVAAILLSGLALKAALMGTNTVSFDSDEAVVALMAKHILAGERPVFFYGQSYMGSLDAFLIAAGYRVFGVSLFAVRLVQAVLFAGLVLATYQLVRRLYSDETTAQITALLFALPVPLLGLYTTITLGGYGEVLLFGTCLLILGHQVTYEAQSSWLRWALLGFIAGLAFWVLPMTAVYMLPVAIVVLRQWRWQLGGRYGLALVAFVLGSSPWWAHCISHPDVCIEPLIRPAASQVTSTGWLAGISFRTLGFLFLGIPSLWGLRNPWSAEVTLSFLAVLVLVVYLGSLLYALRVRNSKRFLPMAMGATFVVIFLITPFGNDATGRYLLPLCLPVALLAAELIRALKRHSMLLAAGVLACVLTFNISTTLGAAMSAPAGMTAQLDARFQFGNEHDANLLSFLEQEDERLGYGNFWVAYKITFLSDEKIVIAPRLSYKADLSKEGIQDRYPAYSRQVDASPDPPFYITSNQPDLDDRLRNALDAKQIEYHEEVIGAYRVFYGLSAKVTPEELGLHD